MNLLRFREVFSYPFRTTYGVSSLLRYSQSICYASLYLPRSSGYWDYRYRYLYRACQGPADEIPEPLGPAKCLKKQGPEKMAVGFGSGALGASMARWLSEKRGEAGG